MPLIKSGSREAIGKNIEMEKAAGKPKRQAIAIALDVARRAKRENGGGLPNAFHALHKDISAVTHPGGLLTSHVAGRTDHLPLKVKAGSYVIPADVVSGLGQGNTLAGGKLLGKMFPHPGGDVPSGKGPAMPYNRGGSVPIMAAGGEYVVTPEALNKKFGDVNKGHKVMDRWVVDQRKHITKTMRKLPGPAKSDERR